MSEEELEDRLSQKDSVCCWTALYYISLRAGTTILVLKNSDGQTATTIEEKETLIREILFSLALVVGVKRVISSRRAHQQIIE